MVHRVEQIKKFLCLDRLWLLLSLSYHEQINQGGQYERKDKRRKGMAPQADYGEA